MMAEGPPGPPAAPLERHPDGEWRADALARSQHSRLDREQRAPDEDRDEARAAALCGEIARGLLGDFAPALLLLPPAERRRVQALVAYARTLFDFARQRGVEGERLSEINRWEFALESALAGQPAGQPVFVAMAREQARRPWPAEALDELAALARRRATRERPSTPEQADADAQRLARAAATALLGAAPAPEVVAFAGALVRLHVLQNLGPEAASRRLAVPESELPEGEESPERLLAAALAECERLRPRLLKAPRGLVELPPGYRRAAMFALLAGLRLLAAIEEGDAALLDDPPRIGLAGRLALLARARWGR
jgi:phytoene/squalene synthetase